jgi:hypothetical protein
VHTTDHAAYRWLNDRVCAVEGQVRPLATGGFDVVFEVSEMIWESPPCLSTDRLTSAGSDR